MEHPKASFDWVFHSTPKQSVSTLRTVPAADTLRRTHEVARHVPITRVSDLTPLDRLRLPVFSATTPLAVDLTTHVGKGLDAESARISAVMEAIERVSAEQVDAPTVVRSFRALTGDRATALDPLSFDLPAGSSYDENREISWVEGWDLLQRERVWLPTDLAVTPPREGVLCHPNTNGLAAGNSLLEAVVHAVCEVIERDAYSVHLFRAMYADSGDESAGARRVRPDALPAPAGEWLDRLGASGLTTHVDLLDSDIAVPVFRSTIIDYDYSSSDRDARRFIGFGAAPDAGTAAIRSITEAVQSRLAVIQGARDSFNTLAAPWRRSMARLRLGEFDARDMVGLDAVPSFASHDLLADLEWLLGRLRTAGCDRVIAVNLTRRAFGIPTVRIQVPGLATFAVNRARIGWRCVRYLL